MGIDGGKTNKMNVRSVNRSISGIALVSVPLRLVGNTPRVGFP